MMFREIMYQILDRTLFYLQIKLNNTDFIIYVYYQAWINKFCQSYNTYIVL